MIGAVTEWLPVDALANGSVSDILEEAVSAWTSHWFGRPCLTAARLEPVKAGQDLTQAGGWQLFGDVTSFRFTGRGASRMLSWVLDAPVEQLAPTATDRRVLERLERALMFDLARRIGPAIGFLGELIEEPRFSENPFGKSGGLKVILTDEIGDVVLTIGLPTDCLVAIRKASMKPRDLGWADLSPFCEVLGPMKVAIQAKIGRSTISMADLRALSAGDVLVLDSGLAQAAEISGENCDEAFTTARLADVEGQVALIF